MITRVKEEYDDIFGNFFVLMGITCLLVQIILLGVAADQMHGLSSMDIKTTMKFSLILLPTAVFTLIAYYTDIILRSAKGRAVVSELLELVLVSVPLFIITILAAFHPIMGLLDWMIVAIEDYSTFASVLTSALLTMVALYLVMRGPRLVVIVPAIIALIIYLIRTQEEDGV